MKSILFLLFLPFIIFSQATKNELIVPEKVRINLDKNEKALFLNDLESFLSQKNEDFTNYELVDSLNYHKYKEIFDELKSIEHKDEFHDSTYYKSYLVNFVKQAENKYLVTIAFSGIDENNRIEEKARVTLLSLKKGNHYQFLCPFDFNINEMNAKQIGNIVFHFNGGFNKEEATTFSKHNKHLATLFNIQPYKIDYYKCKNLQEVCRLFGLDYLLDINGDKRGCFTLDHANIFVSGTNTEEYNHDLTHFYFGKNIAKEKRNWVAEEGFNINLTDYWGFSSKDNYTFLKTYLQNNDVTALEIFEKNRILKRPIPTKMPVAGIIMRRIEKNYGLKAVLEVISCGKTDEDFFKAIEKVAGITKLNFDKIIREELGI